MQQDIDWIEGDGSARRTRARWAPEGRSSGGEDTLRVEHKHTGTRALFLPISSLRSSVNTLGGSNTSKAAAARRIHGLFLGEKWTMFDTGRYRISDGLSERFPRRTCFACYYNRGRWNADNPVLVGPVRRSCWRCSRRENGASVFVHFLDYAAAGSIRLLCDLTGTSSTCWVPSSAIRHGRPRRARDRRKLGPMSVIERGSARCTSLGGKYQRRAHDSTAEIVLDARMPGVIVPRGNPPPPARIRLSARLQRHRPPTERTARPDSRALFFTW
jgi:hypothetical protein